MGCSPGLCASRCARRVVGAARPRKIAGHRGFLSGVCCAREETRLDLRFCGSELRGFGGQKPALTCGNAGLFGGDARGLGR